MTDLVFIHGAEGKIESAQNRVLRLSSYRGGSIRVIRENSRSKVQEFIHFGFSEIVRILLVTEIELWLKLLAIDRERDDFTL
mgnify:CR=1 FL=1